jgi:transcriptional regulator with XRE-family HTH domain
MSDPNTLGSLVRKRRLESGYSLGQLASKVGKTAAEVRAWERDVELPEHGIIDRLASTLEIDLAEIKKRLDEGKKALDAERKAAQQAAAVEDDENRESEPAVIFPEQTPPPAEAPAETVSEKVVGEEPEEDLPGFVVADPFTPPPPLQDDAVASEDEPDLGLLDAPTEAVPVPVITGTAAAARASRAAAVLEEPAPAIPRNTLADEDAGLLRYLEPVRVLFDPHQRYLYWIRAGLTVIVLLILAVILFAQLGNLLDAISELLDTIEPAATDPNDLNALGLLPFI